MPHPYEDTSHAPLLWIERNGLPELTLYGSIAWVAPNGKNLWSLGGNPSVFGRSTHKPFMVRQLGDEIKRALPDSRSRAITLSSHDGTPTHVETARSVLRDYSHLPELLATPHSLPMNPQAATECKGVATAWQHPCSGEHAGIILGLHLKGICPARYFERNHPYAHFYLEGLRKTLGVDWQPSIAACDGCGLPTFAHSLSALAQLYADLARSATDTNSPDRWIWEAMTSHPELIGGEKRTDTSAMRAAPGRVLAKEGADGLLALSIDSESDPEYKQPLGIAIKLTHGFDFQWMPWIVRAVLGSIQLDWGQNMKVPPTSKRQTVRFNPQIAPPSRSAILSELQGIFDAETKTERESAVWK